MRPGRWNINDVSTRYFRAYPYLDKSHPLCYHWLKLSRLLNTDSLMSNQITELCYTCSANQSEHRMRSSSEFRLKEKKKMLGLSVAVTEVTAG